MHWWTWNIYSASRTDKNVEFSFADNTIRHCIHCKQASGAMVPRPSSQVKLFGSFQLFPAGRRHIEWYEAWLLKAVLSYSMHIVRSSMLLQWTKKSLQDRWVLRDFYDDCYCNALGMRFRLRFWLSSGFEVVKFQTERKVGRHKKSYCIYNETQRQEQRENNRETGALKEGYKERCNLRKQKLCLSRTKTLAITRVSHKYS